MNSKEIKEWIVKASRCVDCGKARFPSSIGRCRKCYEKKGAANKLEKALWKISHPPGWVRREAEERRNRRKKRYSSSQLIRAWDRHKYEPMSLDSYINEAKGDDVRSCFFAIANEGSPLDLLIAKEAAMAQGASESECNESLGLD